MDNLELPVQVVAKVKRAAKLINELDALLEHWGKSASFTS